MPRKDGKFVGDVGSQKSSNPRSTYNYSNTKSPTISTPATVPKAQSPSNNTTTSSPDVPGRPMVYREDVELTYDSATETWKPSSNRSSPLPSTTDILEGNAERVVSDKKEEDGDKGSQVQSKKKADKEFIEQEFNTLTGELKVTPSERSMIIRINETVRIEGIGRYLSGNYYVTSVKRTIDKDSGYSHTVSVLKNGFGDSLKKAYTSSAHSDEPRKEEVTKSSPSAKVGDTVKIVGSDAVYSNAHDGVKVPAWVKQKSLQVTQVSSDGSRVLLQPINSWTYVKYIQKV